MFSIPPQTARLIKRRAGPAAVIAAALWAGGALAQGLASFGSGGGAPVEITADGGIEWQQEQLVFVARGDARAVRGNMEVKADELLAYYRENAEGGSDIWRMDAKGRVRIESPGERAFGDHAVYDIENQILVLKGRNVRFITGGETITANNQLEYWELKQMAVARGGASVVREGRTINADVLAAYFRKDFSGETKVFRVDAFDNVKIKTAHERAIADRGVYNVESGMAVLTGDVKIHRGGSTLNGCSAEVNLRTGISKLFSCQDGSTRVQGLIKAPERPAAGQ
ncbi:MAG: LptA/OstA family protein [Rhodospirillales bacterium]